jgi:hypothetical protein
MIGQSWIGVMRQLTGARLAVFDAVLCGGCSTVPEIGAACLGYREEEWCRAVMWLVAHFLLRIRRDGVVGFLGRTTREAELQWLANGGRPLEQELPDEFMRGRGVGAGGVGLTHEKPGIVASVVASAPAVSHRVVHDYQPQFFANV